MESDNLDAPELPSTTSIDHLYYPTPTDKLNAEEVPLLQAIERLVQPDKLYVGNLPPEISMLVVRLLNVMYPELMSNFRVDLHKAFKRFGHISDIQLPYNTGTGGKPKGYAFVMFNNKEVSKTIFSPFMARRPVPSEIVS